jgi:citrate synthase
MQAARSSMLRSVSTVMKTHNQGKLVSNITKKYMSTKSLQDTLEEIVPVKQQDMMQLKKEYGNASLGNVTVEQAIGGARSVKCMIWETSLLDAEEGIRFRGFSIPELQQKLPSFKGPAGEGEPTPEGLCWLMLTGEIPTKEQADSLTAELHKRSGIPAHVEAMLRAD